MKVRLDGKVVTLPQKNVIGSGGEGTVFRLDQKGQSLAVKLYHTPTPEHEHKLLSLTTRAWPLPGEIIALPRQIVRDVNTDNVIGLAMPYFGAPVAEVALLAHKRQRAAHAISTRRVSDIFLNAGQALVAIHSAGLVVGDLNDQNLLFREREALWIDVDAWQFDTFPCPVACEDYLAPELYGVDLSLHPSFAPEHDWYAFAVLLFRSLLLVHPYGGTYPQLPLLTQRAAQGVFVLQPEVTYPKFAYTPELVSDALLRTFERYFRQGWRGTFPLAELEGYRASLSTCQACKQDYPGERHTCPHCQARTQSITRVASIQVGGVKCEELIRTEGSIVFHALAGGTLTVVAYEQESAVLYRKRPLAPLERIILFKAIPGAQYALVGDTLIVNPAYTTRLLCLDISGDSPHPLYQSATSLFTGNKQAIFQGSPTHLYAILNHALVASRVEAGGLSSRSLRVVMDEQTWFSASHQRDMHTVLGYFQVFSQQLFWLQHGTSTFELELAPLEAGESLLNLAAYFSPQDVLLRRLTQERGVEYLHTEILDFAGHVLHSLPRVKRAEHPAPALHGAAYAGGTLLHASDQGIVQERVAQQIFKTLTNTQEYVRAGATLATYQAGLLVIDDHRALALTM